MASSSVDMPVIDRSYTSDSHKLNFLDLPSPQLSPSGRRDMDVQFVAVLSRPADIIEDLPLGIVTGGEPFAMNLEKTVGYGI